MKRRKHNILFSKADKKTWSLTWELVLTIIGLVAGTVFLSWFLNTVFLERYYVKHKQNTLLEGFRAIDEQSAAGRLESSEFDVDFDRLCANSNIAVIVISADRTVIRSSVNNSQRMVTEFLDIIFGEKSGEVEVLADSSDYVIQKYTSRWLNIEYLILYGTLSSGDLILMRSALDNIRESVNLSNQFLAYVGILVVT